MSGRMMFDERVGAILRVAFVLIGLGILYYITQGAAGGLMKILP